MRNGELDIAKLLKSLSPKLLVGEFVFLTFVGARYGDQKALNPIAAIQEEEGLTLVVPKALADQQSHVYNGVFACITLQVHSSLEAVGLTAAVASKLSSHEISANVIAGFFHDHILVQNHNAQKALMLLDAMSG